jgi:ankyrin repeat protein
MFFTLIKIYVLQQGDTALHYAALRGLLEIVVSLISKGCDVNIRNNVS